MGAEYCEVVGSMEKLHILRRIVLQKATADSGLYIGQLPILEYIRHNDGCTQAELAEKMFVSPASIALSTKRMEKEGLLKKQTDKDNLRRNKLTITEKGREVSQECRRVFDEVDKKMFAGLSSDEISQFKELMDKMLISLTGKGAEDIDIFTLATLERQIEHEKMRHNHENRTEGD